MDSRNKIQREIEALRERIGAFYEQSTPTDEEEGGPQDELAATRRPPRELKSATDGAHHTSVHAASFESNDIDYSAVNNAGHSTLRASLETPNIIPIANPSSVTIKTEHNTNKSSDTNTTVTKSPTEPTSNRPRPTSRFTTKVANVQFTIKGNTQLDNRPRSISPSRHYPPGTRHHSSFNATTFHSTHRLVHSNTHTAIPAISATVPLTDKPHEDSELDLVVCTPKQEKMEGSAHVAKKQKLELKRNSRAVEEAQYMMEETFEELYQLVVATKKQVVLDLASTTISLTDFQGRVLQQLKAMENKCRAQQKQHQLSLYPKVEAIPKLKSEGQLQDTLHLEKAKVASLEYMVEELQAKTRELDTLLTERDASITDLLRQLHECDPEVRTNLYPTHSPPQVVSPAIHTLPDTHIDVSRDMPTQLPASSPVLRPCSLHTDTKPLKQVDQVLPAGGHPPQSHDQPTNTQCLVQVKMEQDKLDLVLADKELEVVELKHQISQLNALLTQQVEKTGQLDQLRVAHQASLLSLEVTTKEQKSQNDQLRHSLQDKDRQYTHLTNQHIQLEQKMKELDNQAHNLRKLNQHLQAQEQNLSANNHLKTQHQKLQTQHGELKKICYDQDHTIADLHATVSSLQTQAQGLKAQLQQVEQLIQSHDSTHKPQQPFSLNAEVPPTQLQQVPSQLLEQKQQAVPIEPQTGSQVPLQTPAPQQPQENTQLEVDVKESAQKLTTIQQHAENVRTSYTINTNDVTEVQRIIHELEKIFLETYTEISRLRNILQEEGISPTPLPNPKFIS